MNLRSQVILTPWSNRDQNYLVTVIFTSIVLAPELRTEVLTICLSIQPRGLDI